MTEETNERRIELSEDQFDRLWLDKRAIEMIGDTVANAMVKAGAEAARNEIAFWKTVHRAADADRAKHVVEVDWVNRCIVVRDRLDSDDNWKDLAQ